MLERAHRPSPAAPDVERDPVGGRNARSQSTTDATPSSAFALATFVPRPIAVRNGPRHEPIDEDVQIGMNIAVALTSSSGHDTDMWDVKDREEVSASTNHQGSFAGVPATPAFTGEERLGYPTTDRHTMERDDVKAVADSRGGSGSTDRYQLDVYQAVGDKSWQAVPNSGYLIRRSIDAGPGTRIAFRVDKSPADCKVGDFSTTAGPSPSQGDSVTVRK